LKGPAVGRNQFFCCQPDFLVQNIYGNIHFIHTTLHPPPIPFQHIPILNFLRPKRILEGCTVYIILYRLASLCRCGNHKDNLTKVEDFWQLAIHKRGFLFDLRFLSTKGLDYGFLSNIWERGLFILLNVFTWLLLLMFVYQLFLLFC
jgi:hypothetical protein